MKFLRKDFDYLRKEFGGVPFERPDCVEFLKRLVGIIDNRTDLAGIGKFKVKIVDRPVAQRVPVEEVKEKGGVKKRKSRAKKAA